ncbi:MAG: protein kinase [Acidobacteria bacterium]|nr:protein kinase [Acidobacteriota bacterium]
MEDDKQQQIIRLALAKGLVSEQDLELLSDDNNAPKRITSQNQLEGLIEAGLLSKAMWRALEQEVEARTKSPAFQVPFTLEKDVLAFTSSQTRKVETDQIGTDSLSRTVKSSSTISREINLNPSDLIKAGRYDLIKLLGEGGMGSVFLAYDPDLQRYVALKFLHSGDKEATQRLLQEGRAQAKIEHPNVCKVYEVGKFNGRIYIAMQYIDGEILPKITKQLTLEQKVKIMADVAEGLNAAHKLGLIHRDVKPQNIILEKTDDGEWKPYVMDFGLVREVSQKGMTMTGEILGTPYYMSPEQARGKTALLDRRSDVYSLGATLYELLSGKPPQEGVDVVDLLKQIATEEVTPLRKVNPEIPLDLDTIVMKSLEKELQRRYDSANALAKDLRHYLAGEPIEAKQISLTYYLYRTVVKHKVIVASSTIAFIVLLVASINVYLVNAKAENEKRLSQELGAKVEEIEHMMRHSHMLPLHNINREIPLIETQIAELREKIEQSGDKNNVIGFYALGRAYQEVGNYEQANIFLERAWEGGYKDTKVAYALGIVLNKIYLQRLDEIERLLDRESSELERQKVQEELGVRASKYLTFSKQPLSQSEYAEALIAFYEGNLELALSKSQESIEKTPWLYEAKRLVGDIYVKIADSKKNQDYKGARENYRQAQLAYEEALKIAASDPETYAKLTGLWNKILMTEYSQGRDVKEASDELLKVTELSLKVNPLLTDNYIKRANAYLYLGLYQARQLQQDPSSEYLSAIAEIQAGIKNSVVIPKFYDTIGLIFKLKGEYLLSTGKDPSQDFENSINTYNKALEIDKGYLPTYINISVVSCAQAQYQIRQGQDPTQTLQKAINYCQQAIKNRPKIFVFYNKLLFVYAIKSQYLLSKGEDPSKVLEEALLNFNKVMELNQNNPSSYNYLGTIYSNIGEHLLRTGKDPKDIYQKVIEKFQQKLSNATVAPANYNSIASAYITQAFYGLSFGRPPDELLEKAFEYCEKALSYNNRATLSYALKSRVFRLKALYLIKQKKSANDLLKQAIEMGNKAYEINNGDQITLINLAEIYWTEALAQINDKQDPTKNISQALSTLEKIKEFSPGSDFVYILEGRLYLLETEWLISQSGSLDEVLDKAYQSLTQAIGLNPSNSETYMLLANLYRWKIEWSLKQNKPINEFVEKGLNMVEKSLSNNANNADVYAVKGAIYLLSSQNQQDSVKKELLRESKQSFEKALSLNRLLINEYQTLIDKAQN